jgi:pSer/pThr/pTyr-binding forkhead associated (FHA) protein
LLAAAGIAAYAVARRRGTPRQLAGAMLGCLAAAACLLPAIIWGQTRLDLQGPALGVSEVLLWLSWVAVLGWMLPLGSSMGFLLFSTPVDSRQALKQRTPGRVGAAASGGPSGQSRRAEPLGEGVAWGRLTHTDGPYLGREVPLTRQMVTMGRERDNDILLESDLASRYHAELRWERGRGYLQDHGSMNGTAVNGQRAWGVVPLHNGDLLEIGGWHFRYQDQPAPSASPDAAPTVNEETAPLPGVRAAQRPSVGAGWLVVVAGPEAGRCYALPLAACTIGRSAPCDLVIDEPSLSRRHAQLLWQEDGGWYALDLGSQNGTLLNGALLHAPARLSDGDMLTLGTLALRFSTTPPARVDEAAPARRTRALAPGSPMRLPSRAAQHATDDADE